MKTGIAIIAGVLLAGSLALAASAQQMSNVKTFHATLSGAQEVPKVATAGTGSADLKLDTSTKMLSWTVTYSGLTGPAVAAHIHGPAAIGANAGVLVPFSDVGMSTFTGSAKLSDAQIADLMAGKTYVNIHTAANKGGEIRGQVGPGM